MKKIWPLFLSFRDGIIKEASVHYYSFFQFLSQEEVTMIQLLEISFNMSYLSEKSKLHSLVYHFQQCKKIVHGAKGRTKVKTIS
jgi:hypothetical protein